MWFDGGVATVSEANWAEQLKARLHRIFQLTILAVVVIGAFQPVMNNVDLGWHVAQGRWMVQHGAIYRFDALNYATQGHPVINEYPLFQVVLFTAWRLGWWGPCVLTALGYALLVVCLLRAEKPLGLRSSSLLAAAMGLMLVYFEVAFPLRPHLATYLGVVIFGVFLLRHRESTRWIDFWPQLMVSVSRSFVTAVEVRVREQSLLHFVSLVIFILFIGPSRFLFLNFFLIL